MNWYCNHKNVPTEDATVLLIPVGTIWNARRVIQHLHKDEISQKLKEAGVNHSDKKWFPAYHEAVGEVWKSLGDDEEVQEKYGEMAKTWNEMGPPEEAKRK